MYSQTALCINNVPFLLTTSVIFKRQSRGGGEHHYHDCQKGLRRADIPKNNKKYNNHTVVEPKRIKVTGDA